MRVWKPVHGKRLLFSAGFRHAGHLPQGGDIINSFIVMKTGTHPFVSPLKLFFKWGISFSDMPYTVAEHGARKVCYVSRVKIMQAIASRFPQVKKPKTEANSGGTNLTEPQPKAPIQIRTD